MYSIRNSLLVGTNNSKYLVWGTLAEASANIFFDYGLIYGHFGMPALGFNGAAYASIIAEGMGFIVVFGVSRLKGINQSFEIFKERKIIFDRIRLILVQSSPLILQFAISIITWEYFYLMIEHHGERALAVSNSMRNIFGLTGIFSWAFASTTNTMVSNIFGQKKEHEVLPLIWRISKISFSISLFIVIVMNLFPEFILSVYGQSDAFIADAIPVMRIVSVALLLMSFSTVWLNAVTGTGNTIMNLTIETVTIILYVIYVYLVLVYWFMPITWGWGSEIVYWISMFSLACAYILSGRWKGKVI